MSEGALNAVGWMCAGKALLQSLAAINFPMFLLFGSPGELRNLSLLYVGACGLKSGTGRRSAYRLSSLRKNASISGELDVKRIENPSMLAGSAPTTLA